MHSLTRVGRLSVILTVLAFVLLLALLPMQDPAIVQVAWILFALGCAWGLAWVVDRIDHALRRHGRSLA